MLNQAVPWKHLLPRQNPQVGLCHVLLVVIVSVVFDDLFENAAADFYLLPMKSSEAEAVLGAPWSQDTLCDWQVYCNVTLQFVSSCHVKWHLFTVVYLILCFCCNVYVLPVGLINDWLIGSQGFCRQECHFSFVKKCKFRQKCCHKSRISPVFCRSKMRPFQQRITVTAVNLFYEVLPKQFEVLGFYFSQEKKTGDCWILGILNSHSFCLESHCELADH